MLDGSRNGRDLFLLTDGKMVEWFKAAVLKTAEVNASESSNLSLSAIIFDLIV